MRNHKITLFSVLFMGIHFGFAHASVEDDARRFAKSYARPKELKHPAKNPHSVEKEKLGQFLFFDPRISGSGTMSCGTCHNPALSWQDGLPTAMGNKGEVLPRKTPTILNLGYSQGLFFWDGRAESLEDQALKPITNPNEMAMKDMETTIQLLNSSETYRELFKKAFPENETITEHSIAAALATFERSVQSAEAPFDKWVEGDKSAISNDAKKGFIVFNTNGNCVRCHSGFRFTDDSFHDIGTRTSDKGRGGLSDFKEFEALQFAFKTMTLRNIIERAPYMHNGQEKTLEDVIDFYDKGGDEKRPSLSADIKPLSLTAQEKSDLLEFLKTLSSRDAPVVMPALPVFGKPQ